MNDKSNDDKRRGGRKGARPPSGGGRPPRGPGDRPGRGSRPPARDASGERPLRRRPDASAQDRPERPAGGPKWRGEGTVRPSYRPRVERPGAARTSGDRPRGAPQTPRTHERAEGEERVAKVIARAGVCSRRDAEAMIEAGRVAVNGETLASPARNVGPNDHVTIDGAPLARRERTRLWLFHKPPGCVTTESDPEGRPTILDVLPAELPRVITIGRLDINTEGLLLLTNDGGLARALELPATGWLRRYRVRAHGETDQARLDALRGGVTIDAVDYAGVEAHLDRQQGSNVWLTIGLREGKNREVKRVLEHIGLLVNRLIRVSFGPFQLGELPDRGIEEIPTRVLRDQLGEALAKEAGADFNAPMIDHRRERDEENREFARAFRAPRFEPRAGERDERPRVEPDNKPRQRKHVSALRDKSAQPRPGRVRVERAQTQDRKGRDVKVERLRPALAAGTADRKPDRSSRNARRFSDEKLGRAGAREQRARGDGERKPERPRAPRREFSDAGREERGPRRDFAGKPRGEGRPERSFDKPRGARPPRGDFSDKPRGERPPRRDFAEAPRGEGRARAGKPDGFKKPGARPGGARPGGPRPGGSRSGGGGKPSGSRPPSGPRPPGGSRPPRGPRPPRRDG